MSRARRTEKTLRCGVHAASSITVVGRTIPAVSEKGGHDPPYKPEPPDRLGQNPKAAGRLSVIIPARNEEERIGRVLRQVLGANIWEVIVVDGRSSDRTPGIARSYGVTVLSSKPGRAYQMNTGAAAATGDAFLFLHADTRPPEGFDGAVFRILSQPGVSAGAFGLRIDAPDRGLRVVEKLVNWRSRFLQMPYGDQAIFLKREAFHSVGGFPALDVMEDFELVRRLRRLGRIEIAPLSVVTSARRWLNYGVWRTTLLNQACITAYYLGVPANRIAAWRQSVLPRFRVSRGSEAVEYSVECTDHEPTIGDRR